MLNQDIRKTVHKSFIPGDFMELFVENWENGIYDGNYIFEHYTKEEVIELSKIIDYSKDDNFVYSGLAKFKDSYLTKQYGEIKETPQEVYFLINLFAFAKYEKETREYWVKEGYRILSDFEASLPTPIMIQLRTMFRKFISCNIIPFGDDRRTLSNGIKAMFMLVSAGAGLGLGTGDIRGLGAIIDNGRMEHTGLQPLLKSFEKASKGFVQPNRDGSSTAYYPFYHKEIEHIMVMGNNKGTENTRVRDVDHCIIFNSLFFERYKNGEDITLFYMNDVPDLESYNGYNEEFKKRYEHYERIVPKSRQTKISADKIYNRFLDERFLQAREYVLFADDFQEHSSFDIPVKTSNLCAEISVPTYPLYNDCVVKRNIKFHSEKDREEFYNLRKEAYFHQINEKEADKILQKMKNLYTFTSEIGEEADETKDFD
jgi:ribonucleoside-diphosphate reductase alpha chain